MRLASLIPWRSRATFWRVFIQIFFDVLLRPYLLISRYILFFWAVLGNCFLNYLLLLLQIYLFSVFLLSLTRINCQRVIFNSQIPNLFSILLSLVDLVAIDLSFLKLYDNKELRVVGFECKSPDGSWFIFYIFCDIGNYFIFIFDQHIFIEVF